MQYLLYVCLIIQFVSFLCNPGQNGCNVLTLLNSIISGRYCGSTLEYGKEINAAIVTPLTVAFIFFHNQANFESSLNIGATTLLYLCKGSTISCCIFRILGSTKYMGHAIVLNESVQSGSDPVLKCQEMATNSARDQDCCQFRSFSQDFDTQPISEMRFQI